MKWILLLSLATTHAFGAIWFPHQKEIWSLIRNAERTPEMQIKYNYPGIDKLNVDRRFDLVKDSCRNEKPMSPGIFKLQNFDHQKNRCLYY